MKSIRLWSVALAVGTVLVAACGESPPTFCDPADPSCNPTDTTSAPPLQVLVVDPADGATDVDLDKTVTITFNRPVDAATVTTTSFQVAGATGTISANGATATFVPDADYSDGASMQVTVNGVADGDGVGMASAFTSSFTTRTFALMVDAGPDFDASADSMVTLDKGTASGTGATFSWAQIEGPSVGTLTGDAPTFTAPGELGKLAFELTGTNGTDTQVDTVYVWVLEDADHAIWVSAANGSPSGDGSRSAPLATIQGGIDAADNSGNGADVYVAAGNYAESLTLRSRVSVYGGWSDLDWSRDVAANRPVVSGSATAVVGDQVNDITIEGLEIIAANASGGDGLSSVAVWLDRTDQILLARNVLRAGNGTTGTPGSRGTDGAKGANGSKGGNGVVCVSAGGNGGGGGADPATPDGGAGGKGWLGNGSSGSGAPSQPLGGEGGAGGTGGSKNGKNGETGEQVGTTGSNGGAGGAFGALAATGYDASAAPGGTGGNGGFGWGGGGGGGGHGQVVSLIVNICGAGGGGGGAGGKGGTGGTGGLGGGGSFGVMLLGTATADVVDNEIHTGIGGRGGSGGGRGLGGPGGTRGTRGTRLCDATFPSVCGGYGGYGGYGSAGGPGGYGGGGGGGPSIGIIESASASLTESGNSYTLGGGGAGGFSSGNDGSTGESVNHKKVS